MGSTDMGISYSTKLREKMHAVIKFQVDPSKIVSFTDFNWGPQDASITKLHSPEVLLELFKSRSPSGFIIWLGEPLHWSSKHQKITAHSSMEAKIYATNECYKSLSNIIHLIQDLNVTNTLIQFPI